MVKNNFKKSILIAEMLVKKQFQGESILTAEMLRKLSNCWNAGKILIAEMLESNFRGRILTAEMLV